MRFLVTDFNKMKEMQKINEKSLDVAHLKDFRQCNNWFSF